MKNAIALLRRSIDLIRQNPTLFLGIALLPGIISVPLSMFTIEGTAHPPVTWAMFILAQIALAVVSILMAVALMRAVMNPALSIKDAYRESLPYFWRYILLSIMVGVVVLLGLIALIIPGIIFAVWFAFSYYILVVENIGGVEAMKRSKQLVAGRWWMVFGHVAFVTLVSLAVGIVAGALMAMLDAMLGSIAAGILNLIVSAVIAPIFVAYFYFLYRNLQASPAIAQPAAPEPAPASTPESSASSMQ